MCQILTRILQVSGKSSFDFSFALGHPFPSPLMFSSSLKKCRDTHAPELSQSIIHSKQEQNYKMKFTLGLATLLASASTFAPA